MTGNATPSRLPDGLVLRRYEEGEALEEITDLVHRAYASLQEMGFRYWATHQSVDDTQKRMGKGPAWVGILDERVVAVVVLVKHERAGGCPWYERKDVAKFEQFAVEPALQGRGVGSALLDLVEAEAARAGAAELALDTAEGSAHLIRYYERRGYRRVGYADWRDFTNYRSVVMSKTL